VEEAPQHQHAWYNLTWGGVINYSSGMISPHIKFRTHKHTDTFTGQGFKHKIMPNSSGVHAKKKKRTSERGVDFGGKWGGKSLIGTKKGGIYSLSQI